MIKNYKKVEYMRLDSLLQEAEKLYPEGWDLIHMLRKEGETWYIGIFRKSRK